MSDHDVTQFGDGARASVPWNHDPSRDVATSGAPGLVVEPDTAARPRLYSLEPPEARRAISWHHPPRSGATGAPRVDVDLGDDTADEVHAHHDGEANTDGFEDAQRNRDREVRVAISTFDRRDRAASRLSADRRRRERRARRRSLIGWGNQRRPAPGPGDLVGPVERTDARATDLFATYPVGHHDHQHRLDHDLPTPPDQRFTRTRSLADRSHAVRRFASGPLHGVALGVYFLLTPYVVVTRWSVAAQRADATLIRALLVALTLFWLAFVIQLVRNIARLHHGAVLGLGGTAWLAGLIVAALALGPSTTATRPSSSPVHSTVATTVHHDNPSPRPRATDALGALPMALMAKRRRDQSHFEQTDDDIDDLIALLRNADVSLVSHLRRAIGARRDGVIRVARDFAFSAPLLDDEPVVACVVDDDGNEPLVSFAREGGRLRIPPHWTRDDLVAKMVGLHDGGRIVATEVDYDFLRALAIRSVRRHLVVYLGDSDELDDVLRACAVTVDRSHDVGIESREIAAVSYAGFTEGETRRESPGVYVELLRPDPVIHGLLEPFTPSLRRRCIEMVAYATLHRGEAISGDRLRSRVLVHADVDASMRTLANTATSVRRSLGTDAEGPRLHPVSADGLYRLHGVTSDVGLFHDLVRDARRRSDVDAMPLLIRALGLVHGEPLVGVRHGFEWFSVEGHLARLQREGEWAALALHDATIATGDVERAYWAIERGRLLDPFSDVLTDALARVPRLRQFGRDRTGAA